MQALFSTLAIFQEKFSDGKIRACLFSMVINVINVSRSGTELVINVRNSNIISHFPFRALSGVLVLSVHFQSLTLVLSLPLLESVI